MACDPGQDQSTFHPLVGAVPELVWLYVALAQFPIYLLPHLLKPLAQRLAQEK